MVGRVSLESPSNAPSCFGTPVLWRSPEDGASGDAASRAAGSGLGVYLLPVPCQVLQGLRVLQALGLEVIVRKFEVESKVESEGVFDSGLKGQRTLSPELHQVPIPEKSDAELDELLRPQDRSPE